jgi:hypothetical protein
MFDKMQDWIVKKAIIGFLQQTTTNSEGRKDVGTWDTGYKYLVPGTLYHRWMEVPRSRWVPQSTIA